MNAATAARMSYILPRTLTRRYEKYLSDRYPVRETGKRHPAGAAVKVDTSTGEMPENIGASTGIDDRGTGHESFTVLSSSETGKSAPIMESVKSDEVESAPELSGDRENRVRSIGMDMSPGCPGGGELKFRNASMAADRFHVMRYVYDAVCDVRGRIKKEISAGLSNEKKKRPEDGRIMKNTELSRRSRCALLKPQERWTGAKREVINGLFAGKET